MNLTVEELTDAIFAARDIETLQSQVRDAMIADLLNRPPAEIPANAESGVFPGS